MLLTRRVLIKGDIREQNENTLIVRIISCRKATASERRVYEEGEN